MSLDNKLDGLVRRHGELREKLSAPDTAGSSEFAKLSKEYSDLGPIVDTIITLRNAQQGLRDSQEMMADPDMKEMAEEEIRLLNQQIPKLLHEVQLTLLPKDVADEKNAILEIRAGTGGEEAALFGANLFRMYQRYAEVRGWKFEVISISETGIGGYKEAQASIAGKGVFSRLKFESGVHRVQRVPSTETQGRIHTSACTVAVMPEADEMEEININKADLRIDTFRSSGAGGQHVNKTDSAIRIVHIPTGLVVECQDERSQHKNRARAMSLLATKLKQAQEDAAHKSLSDERRSLVGSGDRSERIRTYNYPQGRVTDHRINLTLYSLDAIMQGDLNPVVQPLSNEYQADLLAAIAD